MTVQAEELPFMASCVSDSGEPYAPQFYRRETTRFLQNKLHFASPCSILIECLTAVSGLFHQVAHLSYAEKMTRSEFLS